MCVWLAGGLGACVVCGEGDGGVEEGGAYLSLILRHVEWCF